MSQQVVLKTGEKPTPEGLEEWNKPIGGEKRVDYIWNDPVSQKQYQVRLPYWVKFAIDVDYVRPGYSLQDYLNGAINGFPARKGEEDDIKKAGFNLVAICNEMGVYKSNLCMQLGGQVYGEEHAGEWDPDWDLVLKYKVLQRDAIIPLWKQARDEGRIKYLLLDDLDSIFSKELWFEDRPLYIKLRKAVNLIRPRVANFCVSAPSLNDVISILNTKITFEVMPFPNRTYMVERYCRFVDQFSSTSNFFRKIMTEYSRFKAKDLPASVWKQYDDDRMIKEDEEMNELEKAMVKSKHKDMTLDPAQKPKAVCPKCAYVWRPHGEMVSRCPRCQTRIMEKD